MKALSNVVLNAPPWRAFDESALRGEGAGAAYFSPSSSVPDQGVRLVDAAPNDWLLKIAARFVVASRGAAE